MSNKKKPVFHFGKIMADELAKDEYTCALLNPFQLYRQALKTQDGKQELYQKALDAALENLMSWERAAIADGFEVVPCTDFSGGRPHPVIKGDKVYFVQRYGVIVRPAEEEK